MHGIPRSRWRLCDLAQALPLLAGYTLAGISRALRRLRVHRKRGRLQVHSPDPHYRSKLRTLEQALLRAVEQPDRLRLLFGDEAGIYRQPSLGATYGLAGVEPTAQLSHRSNTRYRLAATLDAVSGQVVWLGRTLVGVSALCALLRAIRQAYPDRGVEVILVWDNWPVHRHPTVLGTAAALGIMLLWLPTYAPWLNPIEKLWRQLKQQWLHHHRLADQWLLLKERVGEFLDAFACGSPALLRYVGLLPD